MIPWRANQVLAAFIMSMAGVWAATGALVRLQVPVWATVAGSGCVAFGTFLALLAVSLGGSLYGNRIRRAVQGGNREAAALCAIYLRRAGHGGGDDAFFADDPSSPALEMLRRDLAWAGVKASAAEVRQYLAVSRWACARGRGAVAERTHRVPRASCRLSRVGPAAASF